MTDRIVLRAVVVDDEPLARAGLTADLRAIRNISVDVVAQCANAYGAFEVIRRESPDVLFVDIEMPESTGFELLSWLESDQVPPAVILVTAHDRHALRGYDADAVDFLLKPYTPARLSKAVARAAARIELLRHTAEPVSPQSRVEEETGSRRLVITERGRRRILDVREIEWIEARSYCVNVHAPPNTWTLRETMTSLAAALGDTFMRTHRSALVQLSAVRGIVARSRYEHEVLLASGARVPLTQSRRRELEERLKDLRPRPGPGDVQLRR